MPDKNSRQCFYCKEFRNKSVLVFDKFWACTDKEACQDRIDRKYVRRPDMPSQNDIFLARIDRICKYLYDSGIAPDKHLSALQRLLRTVV